MKVRAWIPSLVCGVLLGATFGASLGCGDKGAADPNALAATATAPATAKPTEPTPEVKAPPVAPAPAAAPTTPATPDAEGTVRISGSDQMRFSHDRIDVKAGTKIRIELKNLGTLPKEAMGHNFVLLKSDADVTAFGAKAMGAKATSYIPADASEILAHTKLLGPGESDVIEIESLAPGAYPYVCSFPGHLALMKGMLVVQ
jgi:azurin